jgi:chromosome partitioning protein
MPLVIAFVSQKGGVGKSTLARGLATYAIKQGLGVKLADLDHQQKTTVVWNTTRERHEVKPAVEVEAYAGIKEALRSAARSELLVLDTAGKITDGTTEAAQEAHLLVQPTSPSSDDLHVSVLVFLALERISIPRTKLVFALSRVLAPAEEKYARSYLSSFGYAVVEASIGEQLGYREAMRSGRSIIETGEALLDQPAEALMSEILRLAQGNVGKKRARRAGSNN